MASIRRIGPKRASTARPVQQSLMISQVNHLYCGDCLTVLDRVEDDSIDLTYIDPPFFSQRYYETIWGEEQERFAFQDRWKGGIDTYINYLMERIRKLHRKLKPTGIIYVHLDWHICHYVKVEMDKIFGYNNFRNEIVWCYRGGGVPGVQKRLPRRGHPCPQSIGDAGRCRCTSPRIGRQASSSRPRGSRTECWL